MKRQNLKFLIFLIILALIIVGLVMLEEVRHHPNYAPMFSGVLSLPLVWFAGQRRVMLKSALAHPYTAQHDSIK